MTSTARQFTCRNDKNYGSWLVRQLAKQQDSAQFTDFTLCSQGQSLSCHRAVLAAASPYFSAMFCSGMKEALEGRATIDSISFEVLHSVVQFLYGKSLDIDNKDIENLIEATELLQIQQLKPQLECYICDILNAYNCIHFLKIAEKFDMPTAVGKAKAIMFSDIENVSKSHYFLQLTEAELIDYIQNDELKTPHQDNILYACLHWVLAESDERKPLVLDILKKVRVRDCSASAIDDVLKQHGELLSAAEVKGYLFYTLLARSKKLENCQRKPQANVKWNVMILGGMSDYDSTCYNECWAMGEETFVSKVRKSHSWEKVTTIPRMAVAPQASIVCVPGGFAVVCGGRSKTVNCKFDVISKVWTELPPTPEALSDPIALYMDSNIYVLNGGILNCSTSDKMYILDMNSLTWNKGPARIEMQYRPTCTAYRQAIWVVHNNDFLLQRKSPAPLQMLSSGSSKWELKSSVPLSQNPQSASIVGCADYLYLIGGYDNICCKYDITNDQWTTMTNIPSKMSSHWYGSAIALHNKIYLCGGGGLEADNSISEYNIATDTWKPCAIKLPNALKYFTAALLSTWPCA